MLDCHQLDTRTYRGVRLKLGPGGWVGLTWGKQFLINKMFPPIILMYQSLNLFFIRPAGWMNGAKEGTQSDSRWRPPYQVR